MGSSDGVRNITPLLNITRLWNGISAVSLMRRGLALAFDYATKRVAFGSALSEKALHMDTLQGLQAEAEGAFQLAFYVAELAGRSEAGEMDEHDAWLLRVLTPVMKLTTAKQAVSVTSEVLESFGGAGYVEDTGLPVLLRDSQVLPIWEGTTNVLALDTLRALGATQSIAPLLVMVDRLFEPVHDTNLVALSRVALAALNHAETWLRETQAADRSIFEAGARRFAMTLGRAIELALLIRHAQWSQDHEGDKKTSNSARRFAQSGVDFIVDHS
jgi:hypothetical protein